MKQGDKHYEIFYGVDQQRRKSEYTDGEKKETRYYIGDYEIFTDSLGTEHKIHYLSAENGLCAIYVNSGEQDTLYYAFTDYQGTLMALVAQSDGTTKRFSYDPWGNRRSAKDWTVDAPTMVSIVVKIQQMIVSYLFQTYPMKGLINP